MRPSESGAALDVLLNGKDTDVQYHPTSRITAPQKSNAFLMGPDTESTVTSGHFIKPPMQDQKVKDCLAYIEALLKESQAVHDRVAENIRISEEALRDAKATINMLREELRRIA